MTSEELGHKQAARAPAAYVECRGCTCDGRALKYYSYSRALTPKKRLVLSALPPFLRPLPHVGRCHMLVVTTWVPNGLKGRQWTEREECGGGTGRGLDSTRLDSTRLDSTRLAYAFC